MAIKVVTMGGGHGQYALLKALRQLMPHIDITTIVTMADSGKSSGKLRELYGVQPPGDILQCLIALSDWEGDPDEHVLRRRIADGPLKGDNIGNWFLTVGALATGDFTDAVQALRSVLRAQGSVLPVTVGQVKLWGCSRTGTFIQEEHQFDELDTLLESGDQVADVWLKPNSLATGAVREAIKHADFIVLAPGDLFSSVIPVLLVRGVAETIDESEASIVYVCNLVTTRGQTDNFTLVNFVQTLDRYLRARLVETVLFHDAGIDEARKKNYAAQDKAHPVAEGDPTTLADRMIVRGDFLKDGDLIRHDPQKLIVGLKKIFGLP